MRKTKLLPIITAYFFLVCVVYFCFLICGKIYFYLPDNHFREILTCIIALPIFYLLTILVFRLFIKFFPLKVGAVIEGSSQAFIQNIHVLFYSAVFNLFVMNPLLPNFVMREFYKLLGARLGDNTFCSGTIFDAQFVTAGNNTLMGMDCILIPHVMENEFLAYYPIRLGDNVTIGARAIVHAGVTIGNGAIVASGAIVRKDTVIKDNEIWGGVPARFIKIRDDHK
jgi:acetyltransferase-like isoleucine patch superfamily enzyme